MKKNPDKAIIVNGRIHSLVAPDYELGRYVKWQNVFVSAIRYFSLFLLSTGSLLAENVNLFWDSNSEPDVVSYNVYRGDATGGPYAVINTVSQISNPMYSDVGVDLTTDKFYVVTAVNSAALESLFSNEVLASVVPVGTSPGAPTITIIVTVSP